jgi:hypothetical protein
MKAVIQMMINQRGSAAIMAVAFMVFMTIVVAGLVMLTSANNGFMTQNENVLEAEYAAEAGIVRAKVAILTGNKVWSSWLGIQNPVAADQTKFYVVTFDQTMTDGSAAVAGQTYNITSTGTVRGHTKTITIAYKYPLNLGQFNYVALSGGLSDGGDTHTLTVSSGVVFTNAGTLGSQGSAWINTTLPSNVTLQTNLPPVTYPAIPIPWETSIQSGQSALTNTWGGTNFVITAPLTLAAGTYYVGGSFSQNPGGPITINAGDNVTIYVTGDAAFNDKVIGGNLTVYATNIYPNPSASFTGNMQMFARQNIPINCSFIGYSLFMTNSGNININPGARLIKSFLVSGDNLTMDSGAVVTGSLAAKHTINLNGGTLTFDNTVISNWGK